MNLLAGMQFEAANTSHKSDMAEAAQEGVLI